jgi:hypothetical protein
MPCILVMDTATTQRPDRAMRYLLLPIALPLYAAVWFALFAAAAAALLVGAPLRPRESD